MKSFFYIYGWFFVRPRRWFFRRMLFQGSSQIRWFPQKNKYFWERQKWSMPNFYWVFLYRTIFRFFNWLHWEGWMPFCDWTGGYRRNFPWIARIIHTIGRTTAGFACMGGECFHCGFEAGDQVYLSEDDTGETFILKESWATATPDGTDHRFRGITICPVCGHREFYEDGSF